jgi:hypothetical protein
VASILLESAVHPKIVQELLGHSTIRLTLDTYSHLTPALHRQAAESMDEVVGDGFATRYLLPMAKDDLPPASLGSLALHHSFAYPNTNATMSRVKHARGIAKIGGPVAVIEHFEPAGARGMRITIRGLGAQGRGLSMQLNRQEGGLFRIHFDFGDGRRTKLLARVLSSAYEEWQSGTLLDSSLSLSLAMREDEGVAKITQIFNAAQTFEVTFELLP